MSYVEELEKRNEELQQQVSELHMWVPSWRRLDNTHWEYYRGPIIYGRVDLNRNEYIASGVNGSNGARLYNIKDAQAHVELWVVECLRKEQV